MNLPDRFDYYEDRTDDGEVYGPIVVCTVPGCSWTSVDLDVSWSDLGEEGEIDWDAVHPPHDTPGA